MAFIDLDLCLGQRRENQSFLAMDMRGIIQEGNRQQKRSYK